MPLVGKIRKKEEGEVQFKNPKSIEKVCNVAFQIQGGGQIFPNIPFVDNPKRVKFHLVPFQA